MREDSRGQGACCTPPGCRGGRHTQESLWDAASERVSLAGHRGEAPQTQGSEEVAPRPGHLWDIYGAIFVFTTLWRAPGIWRR